MKSLGWISAVVAWSVVSVAGLLAVVQAQAGADVPVRPDIVHEAPAAISPSPALTTTEAYTVYQPIAVREHFGYVMFADDFSSPASGWYVGEIPEVRWGYVGGEYEILISSGPAWAAVTAPWQAIDGYAFEFDVRRTGGPDSLYGTVFGWSDWEHYYVFVVAPDVQYYGVFRRSGADWLTVVDWDTSTHILTGDATNHLRVERSGSQLAVYANGSELASAVDGTYSGELHIGLYAEAGDPVPVATRFDNVLVTRLSSGRVASVHGGAGTQSAGVSGNAAGLVPALKLSRGAD